MSDITVLGIFVADISFSGNKLPSTGETILGDSYNVEKHSKISYLDNPYTRFKGQKEEQETFFIEDPHGNVLELKTMKN